MKTYTIDLEFCQNAGRNPRPLCVAWQCLETGEEGALWLDGGDILSPFPPEYRMVAHYALAELGCFLELGWPLPTEVIDTLAEARNVRGQVLPLKSSWGLLGVASSLGIPSMSSEHKEEMRQVAMAGDVPEDLQQPLMDYCLDDVRTGAAIWSKIKSRANPKEAIMRGRYLKALAQVERRGIPADLDLVDRLSDTMPEITDVTWKEARKEYPGVIDNEGRFRSKAWLEWCYEKGIPWPRLSSGAPALAADTFKKLADRYSEVRTMAYARKQRAQGRRFEFPLGNDGRLRCMLSPFASDTGRNQPSNSRFIFGASAWMRSAVAAPKDQVLAYVDYRSQELGLAAMLSGDEALRRDYEAGDPYIRFAIRAGAAPNGATKETHPAERATYKVAMLALQYGIGDQTLAQNLGVPLPTARRLITSHQEAYPNFWRWREAVVDEVMSGGTLSTRYGWQRKMKPKDSANSIANFLVQATGGEILRAAVIALEEAGHRVIAPVHDAVLVEMNKHGWQEELAHIRSLMTEAALVVTGGLSVPTDAELVMPGKNYVDGRGVEFWNLIRPVIGRTPIESTEVDRTSIMMPVG
ncbi:DNA polymerase [Akkermansiaceae bacterium]|nr:DNA polymerase [Akkermansiaceae bacterium]